MNLLIPRQKGVTLAQVPPESVSPDASHEFEEDKDGTDCGEKEQAKCSVE
jgi:hypothetical protein